MPTINITINSHGVTCDPLDKFEGDQTPKMGCDGGGPDVNHGHHAAVHLAKAAEHLAKAFVHTDDDDEIAEMIRDVERLTAGYLAAAH